MRSGRPCPRYSSPCRARRISASGGDDIRESSSRGRGVLLLFPASAPFDFLIEAAFGFIAQPFAFEHLAEEMRESAVRCVRRGRLRHVADDVAENVEADKIDGAESGGTSASQQLVR